MAALEWRRFASALGGKGDQAIQILQGIKEIFRLFPVPTQNKPPFCAAFALIMPSNKTILFFGVWLSR
jgi:hypothetical protein